MTTLSGTYLLSHSSLALSLPAQGTENSIIVSFQMVPTLGKFQESLLPLQKLSDPPVWLL